MNNRHKSILGLLGQNQELSVTELSERFGVSGVTIRQDLDYLQEQGFLRRVHGGAVLNTKDDISRRISVNYEKKVSIAERAAGYVQSGETIYLEAGSSNALLARQLASRSDIQVVTSNLFIARTLRGSHVEVILVGGQYQHDSESIVGSLAKLGLQSLNFSKAFIGIDGCTESGGVTISNMMRAEIAATAIEKAPEVFIITDSSKFGNTALARLCAIDEVTHVITDSGLPKEYRRLFAGAGAVVDTGRDEAREAQDGA